MDRNIQKIKASQPASLSPVSWCIAIGLHLLIPVVFLFVDETKAYIDPDYISVELILSKAERLDQPKANKDIPTTSPPSNSSDPKTPKFSPRVKPKPTKPVTNFSLVSELDNEVESTEENEAKFENTEIETIKTAPKVYIPSRWALKPPLSKDNVERFEGLAEDLDCLQSLSEDCAKTRSIVFAEYNLTQTELVWTPLRADTGMPVEFHGLSEREIRKKLGVKIAGENGLYIPFTNIGLNGAWWDRMNGVNKICKLAIRINPETGRHEGTRVCPKLLEAQ